MIGPCLQKLLQKDTLASKFEHYQSPRPEDAHRLVGIPAILCDAAADVPMQTSLKNGRRSALSPAEYQHGNARFGQQPEGACGDRGTTTHDDARDLLQG